MKNLKIIIFWILSVTMFSCDDSEKYQKQIIESGETKPIIGTRNCFIGTDSTILIVDEDNGKILQTIKRK